MELDTLAHSTEVAAVAIKKRPATCNSLEEVEEHEEVAQDLGWQLADKST